VAGSKKGQDRKERSGISPLEDRAFLGDEGAVGALEVAGLHADGLGLGLGLDGLHQSHGPFLVELGLGHGMGEGGALGEPQREGARFLVQALRCMERVPEPPGETLLGAHGPSGVEELRRAALADDARQHGAGAHVAARKAHTCEQEGASRLRRGKPEVRGHGDDGACADCHPVHRRDYRLAAGQHRLDEVAGHPRKGQEVLHRLSDQRTDDIVTSPPEQKLPPFDPNTTMSTSEA
jgi:hypothetical protein